MALNELTTNKPVVKDAVPAQAAGTYNKLKLQSLQLTVAADGTADLNITFRKATAAGELMPQRSQGGGRDARPQVTVTVKDALANANIEAAINSLLTEADTQVQNDDL